MDAPAISAVFTGLVAMIGAVVAGFVVWNGRAIHKELKTINSLKPGELLDATETRRIEAIPHDDRTAQEQDHLNASPPLGAPQGPSPTVAERTEAIYKAVNGKPEDQPSLYDMVQTLDMKFDGLVDRFCRLEEYVGAPHEPPEAAEAPVS